VIKKYLDCFRQQFSDLPLFALLSLCCVAAGIALAKWLAIVHAFEGSGLGERLAAFPVALSLDLCILAGAAIPVLLLRRVTISSTAARRVLIAGIYLLLVLWLLLTFISLEIYKSLGSPLKYHILVVSPKLAKYLLQPGLTGKSASDFIGFAFVVCAIAIPPLFFERLRSVLVLNERWRASAWALVLILLGAGGALALLPARGFREMALRNMTVLQIFIPDDPSLRNQIAPPSPAEIATLKELCTPAVHEDAARRFSSLPRKKYNIIVWAWESVGERYLKSHHPLGQAQTPNLDRIAAAGAVRFSKCYVESPLSIQSGWSLLTGCSPPARPIVFLKGERYPEQHGYLPKVLKEAGYRSVQLNGADTNIWNMVKLLKVAGYDLFEDCNQLPKGDRAARYGWGAEDEILTKRFWEWVDAGPKEQPFFAVLWNVETHHPYVFKNMPASLASATQLMQYNKAIEHTDAVIGQLYDELVRRKLDENTILVIAGDHGEGLGRPPRPFDRAHSMLVYEDDIHVPMLFCHPALKKDGGVVDHLCLFTDLNPTLLDLVSCNVPAGIEGRSLARPYESRPLFSRSITWWPLSVRAGRYKVILNSPEALPELYDIEADPTESEDIAGRQIDIANALTASMLRMSAERMKKDFTFEYGFSFIPSQQSGNAPTAVDILKPAQK